VSEEDTVYFNTEIVVSKGPDDRWWSFEYNLNYHDDYDQCIVIGEGEGHILENPLNYHKLVEMSDEIDQSCYELCVDFDPVLAENEPGAHIVTIESMKIEPDYRGRGVGLEAMTNLLEFFEGDIVLILPYPIKGTCPEDQIETARKKLQKHWGKCGFERMRDKQVFYYSSWSCRLQGCQ
jgi:hypothetical protein